MERLFLLSISDIQSRQGSAWLIVTQEKKAAGITD
jgi:hypothetical protein